MTSGDGGMMRVKKTKKIGCGGDMVSLKIQSDRFIAVVREKVIPGAYDKRTTRGTRRWSAAMI